MKGKDDRIEIEEDITKEKIEKITKLAIEPYSEEVFDSEEDISDLTEWEDNLEDQESTIYEIMNEIETENQISIVSNIITIITTDIMERYNHLQFTEQTKKEDYLITIGMLQIAESTLEKVRKTLNSPINYEG